jgi:hypothetical protein
MMLQAFYNLICFYTPLLLFATLFDVQMAVCFLHSHYIHYFTLLAQYVSLAHGHHQVYVASRCTVFYWVKN